MNVTASDLKSRLGQYLEAAQAKPAIVEKSGGASSVVLSKRRSNQLCRLEDMLWDMKARNAKKEGFLSDEELREMLAVAGGVASEDVSSGWTPNQDGPTQAIQAGLRRGTGLAGLPGAT